MEVFLIIAAVVGLLLLVLTQTQARQQVDVDSSLSLQRADEIVRAYFGVIWTSVSGPGTHNYRPKLRLHAPTISISVARGPNGGSQIAIWTSHYDTKIGCMYHAGLMWRKKRGLVKRLSTESV